MCVSSQPHCLPFLYSLSNFDTLVKHRVLEFYVISKFCRFFPPSLGVYSSYRFFILLDFLFAFAKFPDEFRLE